MENINNLYKYAVKCDDQQQYKSIIEAAMVSTTEIFTDNHKTSPGTYVNVRNTSTRKSLHQFSEVLDEKKGIPSAG